MAGTVLKLALVAAPVAGLLLFLGTRGIGTDAPEPPPAEAAMAPPAAVEPPTDPVLVEAVAQGLTIELHPREDCWVSLTLDGSPEPVIERTMRAGETASYDADDEIDLIVGDAGAFAFTINQQDGRSLGASKETVTLHITRENYRRYLAR